MDLLNAYLEDLPNGDATCNALELKQAHGQAELVAKEDLILSGKDVVTDCLAFKAPDTQIFWQFENGDPVLQKQTIALIEGNLVELIQAERVALNFLGHLSGIATITSQFVAECKNTKTQILDTRKTLPGFRALEKQAVRDGGGTNHRMNLSDAILIKENHIRMFGGFKPAIEKVKSSTELAIEVETTNLDEVKMAVDLGVSRIMLDNMDNATMEEALKLIPPHIESEASGNMSVDRIAAVAALGVDFISVGAITHSAPVADISLLFHWEDL